MTDLKTAIRNKRNPGSQELENIQRELENLKRNPGSNYYDVLLEEMFEKKFQEFKLEIKPFFETWITETFDGFIKNEVKGKQGDRGIQGIQGERGPQGETGARGEKGDSVRGEKGEKGETGNQGERGEKGDTGENGESVVVSEVMELFRPEIEKLQREFRTEIRKQKGGGGGGGMGNPTTFSFTGDGSTTEFTLSSNVAANGLACWAYVNGQWIQPGVHFNISGKTLTTTMTLESVDTLEGFFIRT